MQKSGYIDHKYRNSVISVMVLEICNLQRISMATQALHAPARGLTELFLIKYFALAFILFIFSFVSMTAF